jgi:hypothetical protein
VSEKLLVAEAWEAEPEKVMGAGNKTLEMAIAQQLMEYRNLFDPEPQREILRIVTGSITDDPALAMQLVPEQPHVSDSVHDAQLAAGTLMQGLPVAIKSGVNRIEYVETLLGSMALVVKKAEARGGVDNPDELVGLENLAQHIGQNIGLIAQDKKEKERVKHYVQQLAQLMQKVQEFTQALQKKQQEKQQQGQQMDPQTMAKIQAILITAKAKADNATKSHAARTAQKQLTWEMEERRKQQQHQLEMQNRMQEHQVDLASKDLETAAEIRHNRMRALDSDE